MDDVYFMIVRVPATGRSKSYSRTFRNPHDLNVLRTQVDLAITELEPGGIVRVYRNEVPDD